MKKELLPNRHIIELLSDSELFIVRGGSSEEKGKTKETDVYDTRDI